MKEADKLLEGPDEMYDALVDYGFDKHEASVAAACKDIIEFRLTELLLSTRDPFPRDWSDLEDFAESCRRLEIRGLPEKPVAPTIVAAHLRRLILEGRSHEDVLRAAATIDAAHDIHGFSPPSGHSYVKTVLAFNRQRTPTHGDEETASPVAADLQTALDALESKLPHLAHLGSDGRTKVYDLIRRAKVLLNPEEPIALATAMNKISDELDRIVGIQSQRLIDLAGERTAQQLHTETVRLELARQKEERRLERISVGALGG